ncbi:MAG: hemerythrin domain-containing protein, partial [Acidimicrobiales bacterium]
MTTTDTGAFEVMLAHHAALAEGVAHRAAVVVSSVEGGAGHDTAVAELLFYVATEVLPHALAEERTVYRAAMERDGLSELVAGMVDEHRRLASSLEQLARASAGPEAAAGARALGALFAAHVIKENELVLPPLRDDPELDLAALLAEMHRLTEADPAGAATADTADTAVHGGEPDTEGVLVRLLLAAASGLAAAGEGDQACRLAGETWASVRVARPDLAVRVTAALHRLVRALTAEPVTLSRPSPASGGDHADATLDVRALAPAQRHEKIFATY